MRWNTSFALILLLGRPGVRLETRWEFSFLDRENLLFARNTDVWLWHFTFSSPSLPLSEEQRPRLGIGKEGLVGVRHSQGVSLVQHES